MKIKERKKNGKLVPFSKIRPGQTFSYKGVFYMRLDCKVPNIVNINTAALLSMAPQRKVRPVNGSFEWSDMWEDEYEDYFSE